MNAKEALDRAEELLWYTHGLGNNNWHDKNRVYGLIATLRRNLEEAQAAINKARKALGLEERHDYPFNKPIEVSPPTRDTNEEGTDE